MAGVLTWLVPAGAAVAVVALLVVLYGRAREAEGRAEERAEDAEGDAEKRAEAAEVLARRTDRPGSRGRLQRLLDAARDRSG